jgi:ankyrin repeat protein
VLHWTCVCNNVDLLRLLLAHPALNIDVRASNSIGGVTALQLSIHLGSPHLVEMLLEHDPPPNLAIRDSDGMIPLGLALRKMDLRCVQSLLK